MLGALGLETFNLPDVPGGAEEGPLAQAHPHRQQFLTGLLVAHELSHHQGPESLGQLHHRLDDQAVGGVVFRAQAAHVFPGDFEQIDGQMFEVVEAAEGGSEVVQRQPAAEFGEHPAKLAGPFEVGHRHRFRELKDQQLAGEAGACQVGFEELGETIPHQGRATDVHPQGDGLGLVHLLQQGDGPPGDPLIDVDGHAEAFGRVEEHRRGNQDASGGPQPDHQLVEGHRICLQIDHRFGVQHEAVVVEGFSDALRPQQPGRHLFVQAAVGGKYLDAASARFLGLVQGQVGVYQHVVGALAIVAVETCHPAAGGHGDALADPLHNHSTYGLEQLFGVGFGLAEAGFR